ncbi:MAG TPA: hypothetical protein VEQ65_03970, partial [Opitutus sp.]|nr:hypothetical protein [Opitutus sp.]
ISSSPMIIFSLLPTARRTFFTLITLCCLVPLARANSAASPNPFHRFFGEWTLKEDRWTHNWGRGTETIKIPQHHTLCRAINTDNSLLAVVDGPPPHGHILWLYDRSTGAVLHLSSFGPVRIGTGGGTVNVDGDVSLKVSFSDEAPGTYRRYTYHWVSDDEYELRSVQYDKTDQPTGLFYGGYFVRLKRPAGQ